MVWRMRNIPVMYQWRGKKILKNSFEGEDHSDALPSVMCFPGVVEEALVEGRCSGKTCQGRLASSLDPTRSVASQPSFVCKSM